MDLHGRLCVKRGSTSGQLYARAGHFNAPPYHVPSLHAWKDATYKAVCLGDAARRLVHVLAYQHRGNRGVSWDLGGGAGPGAGPGRGRGGAPVNDDPDKLYDVFDLPTLADRVEQRVEVWSVATLVVAFNKLAKVGTNKGADPALRRRTSDALMAAFLPYVPTLRYPKDCALTLWALSKLGLWHGGLAEGLLRRLGSDKGQGGGLIEVANDQDHANVWLAVSDPTAPPGIVALAEDVLRASAVRLLAMMHEHLGSQACANILLACARLRRREGPLVHHLTECQVSKADADRQAVANTLYSLGVLAETWGHVPRSDHLQLLAEMVVERLEEQQGREQEQLEDRQEHQGSSPRVSDGNEPAPGHRRSSRNMFLSVHLAQMLLGCAKLTDVASVPPRLPPTLSATAGRAAARMNAHELATSLYALAKMGCTGTGYAASIQRLSAAVHQHLQQQPDGFVPQSLANILWALEKLRPPGQLLPELQPLVRALAEECKRHHFAGFIAQDFSNTTMALAKMGWSGQGWWEAVVAAASEPGGMAGAALQAWSNVWYALALVRHRPAPGLLESMVGPRELRADGASTVTGVLDAFRTQADAQDCSSLLWALAVLDVHEQRLVGVLVKRLVGLRERGDEEGLVVQDLTTGLWALAVMGPEALLRLSDAVEGLLHEAVRRWEATGGRDYPDVALRQLWQVQQELVHLGGDTGLDRILAAGADSPRGSLLAAARRSVQEALEAHTFMSQQVEAVVNVLLQLQQRSRKDRSELGGSSAGTPSGDHILAVLPMHILAVLPMHLVVDGLGRRVDVLVELAGGRRVAVDVLGPGVFLANLPSTRIGPVRFREQLLGRLFGEKNVVAVPYWEWAGLQDQASRQEYLCRRLGLQVPKR